MKNFKTIALFSAVCFLLAFVAGCGGRVELLNETESVGGSGGSSGSGGSVATGGSAGQAGAGGEAATGGSSGTASGGQAGAGGEAGAAEDAGVDGDDADADGADSGSTDCDKLTVMASLGYETPKAHIITPWPWGYLEGGSQGLLEILLTSSAEGIPSKVSEATVCQIDPNGTVMDFTKISMSWASQTFIAAQVPIGSCWTLKPVGDPFVIPPGGGFLTWISANAATPVPSSSGSWYSAPRSGHTPRLEFKDLTVTSLDGACTKKTSFGIQSTQFVLRKTQPSVTPATLQNTKLQIGDIDLYKFQITPDNSGPVAAKSIGIAIQKNGAFSIGKLRLRKGSSDLPDSSYFIKIWDFDNATYSTGAVESQMKNVMIFIQFTTEEVISGQGSVFTLHGATSAVIAGQSMDVGFGYGGPESEGFLTSWLAKPSPPDLFVLYTPEPYNMYWANDFIWSDLSEVPHSDAVKSQGGSRDWVASTFVKNLDWSTTKTTLIAP